MKIDFGTKVRKKDTPGAVWTIVGLDPAWVMLSGPFPCRGVKHLHRKELEADWELVDKEAT